jgi:hypothetical protein
MLIPFPERRPLRKRNQHCQQLQLQRRLSERAHPQCDYRRGWPELRQRPQGFRDPNERRPTRARQPGARRVAGDAGPGELAVSGRRTGACAGRNQTRFVSRQQPARRRGSFRGPARRDGSDDTQHVQAVPAVNGGLPDASGQTLSTWDRSATAWWRRAGTARRWGIRYDWSRRSRRAMGPPRPRLQGGRPDGAGLRPRGSERHRRPGPASGGSCDPQSSQPFLGQTRPRLRWLPRLERWDRPRRG